MSDIVLIAGAGPVGLVMAAELRRYGIKVRVVEKEQKSAEQSRALFLWTRTLELLARGGATPALLAAGDKLNVSNIFSGKTLIGRVDFSGIDSEYPYALVLPQARTEAILADELAKLGVTVERGTELTGFTSDANGVTATLTHPDGKAEAVRAAYLIGCDGGGSFVRQVLGITSATAPHRSSWYIADVELENSPFPRTEFNSFWHEDGFMAVFPMPGGRFRIVANASRVGDFTPGTPPLEKIQAILDDRGPGGITAKNPAWLYAFYVQEQNLASYRKDRVFLAGDAAHVHNPVGAQGLNMGVHDACNLAWKLAMVLRGIPNAETLLDSYTIERQAVAERVVANLGRAAQAATVRNPTLQFARNLLGNIYFGLAPGRRQAAETLSEVSFSYDHSPINGIEDHALPGPHPGQRVAQKAGELPFGAGSEPRFALLGDSSPKVNKLRETFSQLLEAELRPPLSPRCVWLVRPDGYVAALAMREDVDQIAEYLQGYVPSAEDLAAT
jgi:2-polyprenyl-6-methoxyphenol hydroxylase-like FAD-dependent oxidoreductase